MFHEDYLLLFITLLFTVGSYDKKWQKTQQRTSHEKAYLPFELIATKQHPRFTSVNSDWQNWSIIPWPWFE
jgi:hypothetical protein